MNSSDWGTPQDFFDRLDTIYKFTVDAAANKDNAKCDRYVTEKENALIQSWEGERVFLSPPSRAPEFPCKKNADNKFVCKKKTCKDRRYHNKSYIPGVKDWVEKCHIEAQKGTLIVALLPSRTGNAWWHEYVWDESTGSLRDKVFVDYIKGRLRFEGAKDTAQFDSVLVIWNKNT